MYYMYVLQLICIYNKYHKFTLLIYGVERKQNYLYAVGFKNNFIYEDSHFIYVVHCTYMCGVHI